MRAWDPEGIEQGRLSRRQELLLRQIGLKFGSVPEHARAAVAQASLEALDAMAERILTASAVAQVLGEG